VFWVRLPAMPARPVPELEQHDDEHVESGEVDASGAARRRS